MKKQVGIWIRVSTEDQAKGESPEHHEMRGKMYAEVKNWDVVEIYHLEAVSGKTVLNHPEAIRMINDIASGKITGLIFSKIARLARNTRELLQIADIFREHNADLISLQESIDTSSPAGRFFYTLISAMAQWEREEIAERVAASIPIRAKLGKSLGGQAPYGYEWKEKKLVINEEEATIRKLIYDLFLEHKRRKTVATILNKRGFRTRNNSSFSDTTVTRLLEDPIAKGLRRVNYTESTGDNKHWIYKNKEEWIFQEVPAIISEEKWEKVNSIITELSKTHKKPLNKKINIFTGFLLCSCGNRMFAISGPYYKCCKCQNKITKVDIEEIFHQQLTNYIISNDKLEDYINASKSIIIEKENQLKILQKEAQQIQSKMDNLLELHLKGEIPTEGFKHHHNPLYEQLKQIETQTPIIEGEILALKQNEENGKFMFKEAKTLYDQWETFSKDEKRNIVESITDSIIVGKEDITINLKYLVPPFPNKNPEWATQRQGFVAHPQIQINAKRSIDKRIPKVLKTYGDHIKAKRITLQLDQKTVAKTLGISIETLINWERNKRQPFLLKSIPKIISFLGYSPISYGNKYKQFRIERGLTAFQIAKILKVDTRTVARIEKGKSIREDIQEKFDIVIRG